MGHYALLMVAGAVLAGSILMSGLHRDTYESDHNLGLYQTKQLTRDAAITGVNLTFRKLAAELGPWDDGADYEYDETDYEGGTFETNVTPLGSPLGDTVDVVAVGRRPYISGSGVARDTSSVLQLRVIREYQVGGLPPALQYAITTDESLELQGNINVLSYSGKNNANIHTNGILTSKGNSFLVEGFGTYTTGTEVKQDDNFRPINDTNGPESNVFHQDSLDIPALEVEAIREAAHVIESGDFVIDGDSWPYSSFGEWALDIGASGGSGEADDPFVFLSEGTLTFLNQVEMDGYALMVSLSDIVINPQGHPGGVAGGIDEYKVELFLGTTGSIDIRGNAENIAYLHAEGYVTFRGTPNLIGGITAKDTYFSGGGNPLIQYAGPGDVVTSIGFGGTTTPTGPVILAFAEW